MGSVVSDLRYAAREFRRRPGFTLTAVLSLALGVGATSAAAIEMYVPVLLFSTALAVVTAVISVSGPRFSSRGRTWAVWPGSVLDA